MYEVYLERAAEHDILHLPQEASQRVISHIKALAEEPRPFGYRKIAGSKRDWRIRVGEYRVIYEIDAKTRAVRVEGQASSRGIQVVNDRAACLWAYAFA